jgi:hypothetical protein
MPPRVPSTTLRSSSNCLRSKVATSRHTTLPWPKIEAASQFSTSACLGKTSKLRRDMYQWFKRDGAQYESAHQPSYVGPEEDQPFPMNPLFRSQPVLGLQARELIYNKVVVKNESLKAVSAELGIDIRRVAAVVRLMTIEKQWIQEVRPI